MRSNSVQLLNIFDEYFAKTTKIYHIFHLNEHVFFFTNKTVQLATAFAFIPLNGMHLISSLQFCWSTIFSAHV